MAAATLSGEGGGGAKAAGKPAGAPANGNADLTAWLAVVAGAIGALMATLDISIVNSALPTIQGEIGASGTEGTWIATSYLVAEIVIIPLTAWLERVFGLKRFLLIASVCSPGSRSFAGFPPR
jgi:DHA2 family multidrug resistance protein